MPELPEVETTRRGIEPHVIGRTVQTVVVRDRRLRWPVTRDLTRGLVGQAIRAVTRRGKYLLLTTPAGTVIAHLGMSGSLRVVPCTQPPGPHDHVDVVLDSGDCLRLRDPRRFGSVLWSRDPARHRLLRDLGPEPLGAEFSGAHLYARSRGRRRAIRDFLLDGHIVAGIGNIYANEALFAAGIDPRRAAGRIGRERYERLAGAVRTTLLAAIRAGGTTLRDFRQADGNPGYFQQTLQIYGRDGLPCMRCGAVIRARTLGARRVFFCPNCQL